MSRFVTISGCSGGGKSSLLAELARRGHAVVEEPGRRIVREGLAGDGAALPWSDPAAFARRTVAMALDDQRGAPGEGWVFFDRGLVDAAVALEHAAGVALAETLGAGRPFHCRVFLAPPWLEIYVNDPERPHGFDAAVAEYGRLVEAYGRLGCKVVVLPKVGIGARADFVVSGLTLAPT